MQPKNILFETGTPKFLAAALDGTGAVVLPIDDFTQVLDLRDDPDNTVVRRLHLWAHWNYVNGLDPPDAYDCFVSVIDDTITDPTEAVIRSVANGVVPIAARYPVKILDDYPVRGPVRVVAGTGPSVLDVATASNMVIWGYYTVAGEDGTRAPQDRRPFQLGSAVQVDGAYAVLLDADGEPVHDTIVNYIDEITLKYYGADQVVFTFSHPDGTDATYILLPASLTNVFTPVLEGPPMRGDYRITGSAVALGYGAGSIIRY